MILNNLIFRSRSEGIFCIEGGYSWIKHNDIFDNSDGIIIFDSCNHISNNQIHENQRSGIICSGSSFPSIEQNQIFGNNQTGITVRDNSRVEAKQNKLFANYYQFSMKSLSQAKQNRLCKKNSIEGENEFYNNTCFLFWSKYLYLNFISNLKPLLIALITLEFDSDLLATLVGTAASASRFLLPLFFCLRSLSFARRPSTLASKLLGKRLWSGTQILCSEYWTMAYLLLPRLEALERCTGCYWTPWWQR